MKQSIRKLMTLLLLFTCSIGAWAEVNRDDGIMVLNHDLGANVDVVLYYKFTNGQGADLTENDIEGLVKEDKPAVGDFPGYVIAYVEPHAGYWTNENLLFGRLVARSSILQSTVNSQVPGQVMQAQTRGVGIAGDFEVKLIKSVPGRNDGAGWYYYKFELPENTLYQDYSASILDGFVLPKFDLSSDNVLKSTDGKTFTFTVENNWITELSIDVAMTDETEFVYNKQSQGPTELTNTSIVVKRFDTDKNEYVEAVKFDAEGDVAKHVTASVSAKTGSSLNADEAIDAGSYALTIKAASAEAVVVNGANTRGSSEAIVGSGIFTNSKDVDFTITQKEVEIVPTVSNKVYDGTKNATIASATIETGIDGEALKYVSGLTAEFEDANVGTGKRVDITGTPKVEKDNDNTNVANYTFTVAEDVKANITAKTIKDDPNAQNGEGAITIVLDPTEYTYDKTEKKPAVTVKDGETTVAATEYNVAYKDNVNAGTATVTITDKDGGNYNVSGTKTFTIKQAALTITADAKSKVFGAKDPELTYKAEGLAKGDELTGALARAEGENVGEYDITQGKLSAGDNYTIAFTGAKLKITAKTIKDDPDAQNGEGAITIELNPTEYTYDKTEKKPAVTVKDGETTVAASEYKIAYKDNINAGTATVTITDKENGNYNVSGTKTFTIKKAALTITAEAKSKKAGEADPKFTYTTEGLVTGDELKGALARETGEDVGEYAITQGTLEANDNYEVTYKGAKLTITSASFAEDDVKAEGYEGIYDGKPHTITVTAPKSATVQYGKTEGTYGNEAPTYTNVGEYTVYYQVTMANTNPVTGNKKVVIKKAALTITADAKTKVEGEDDPELTYTTKGLVEGDKLTGALTREAGEKAGTYDILQGTLKANDNYKVSFVGAKLTITAKPAPPTPTVKTYTVSVVQTDGGKVNVSHTEAKAGEQVNMLITPDEKYYLESLTVAKAKGGSVQYYDTEDGKGNSYKSFKMPEADVIVTVAFGTYETPEKKQNIFIFKANYGEVISNKLYADGEKQEQVNLKAKTVKGYEHCILDELFVYNEKFEPLPISSTMTEEEGLIYHFVMRGEKAFVYNTFKGTNNIVDESQALPPDYSLYLFNNIYDHFFNLSKGAEGVQLAMSLVANILATFTPEEKLQLKQGDDDVRMRIINSKMGWLIKFDYIGALRALNPGLFKLVGLNTRGTEEGTPLDSDGTILSGAYYRVLEDTDLDFLLESTTGPLLIESISVIAPEDDDPTGISRLKADEADTDIYDLRGRKVDSTNLRKGVYIKNGHKVVIK
jgi:hypothetical protein